MDSRERVESALALERPDRPPVGAWGHSYVDEWDPLQLVDVTVGRANRYAWDFVKFQPRATCFAEAFGGRYQPSGSAIEGPVLLGHPVRGLADWGVVPTADAGEGPLAQQVEAIARVVSELGSRIPVIQTVFSPLTVAGYLRGADHQRAALDLLDAPEAVGPALARIADALVDFSERSLAAGAAGIFYAISGHASKDAMSRTQYEEVVLPYDLAVLGRLPATAWFNVLHLCGPRLHFDLARLLPAQAVSWDVHEEGNPSLKDGRAASGRAVMGGVGHKTTLVTGAPQEVASEAHHAITETGGRGLLLAPGCSVPPDAPEANLAALARAAADAKPSA